MKTQSITKQIVWSAGNATDQVETRFTFESDWLIEWREFFGPITAK